MSASQEMIVPNASFTRMSLLWKSTIMANGISDPGCEGEKWTIEVPEDSEDGTKTQRFSRQFLVASLECVKA